MGEQTRQTVWTMAAGVVVVALPWAWWLAPPPRPESLGHDRPGPIVAEAFLCSQARAGAAPQTIGRLVEGGGAIHGNVQVAANDYVTGRGSITRIVNACTAVGA